MAYDDDGFEGYNFYIEINLTAGTKYSIRPTRYSVTKTAFTMKISRRNPSTVTLYETGQYGNTSSVFATSGNPMPAISTPTRTGYAFAGYYGGTSDKGTTWTESANSSITNHGILRQYVNTPSRYTSSTVGSDLMYFACRTNFVPDKFEWCDKYDITDQITCYKTSGSYYYWEGFFYYGGFQTNGDQARWIDLNTTNTSATMTNIILMYGCTRYYTYAGASAKNYDGKSSLYARWMPEGQDLTLSKQYTYYADQDYKVSSYKYTPTTTGVYSFISNEGKYGDNHGFITTSSDYSSLKSTLLSSYAYNVSSYFVARNDDGNGYPNFLINAYLEAGTTYYFIPTSHSSGNCIGYFTVYYRGYNTVSLNVNGGSGGTTTLYGGPYGYSLSNTAYYGTSTTAAHVTSITKPSRTGYTFNGYYTATSGGTQCINSSGSISASTLNSSLASGGTLYAQWTVNSYTVVYNANGATGSMASQTVNYGVTFNLTGNAFVRTGYTFKGWATTASGSVAYANSASVSNLSSTNGATVTLYAVWELNPYTITFNANGGSVSPTTKEVAYGTVASGFPTPTRTAY